MDDTSILEPRPSDSARRSKAWRENNPEQAKASDKASKLKHRVRILPRQKEHNVRRAEQKRAEQKAWRAAHPEQANVRSRDWGRKNPDGKRAHDAKYRESHREELQAKNRAITLQRRTMPGYREAELARLQRWSDEHPDEKRASVERRRSRKVHAAINDFTVKQWRALCKAMGYRCAYCGEKFPFDMLPALKDGDSGCRENPVPFLFLRDCPGGFWLGFRAMAPLRGLLRLRSNPQTPQVSLSLGRLNIPYALR